MFREYLIFHHVVPFSDHHTLALNLKPDRRHQRKKKLRFEFMWTRHDNCVNVVANTWKENQAFVEDITTRIAKVSTRLMKWNKEKFGQVELKLSNMEKQLQQLNEKPPRTQQKMIMEWRYCEDIKQTKSHG